MLKETIELIIDCTIRQVILLAIFLMTLMTLTLLTFFISQGYLDDSIVSVTVPLFIWRFDKLMTIYNFSDNQYQF